MRIKLQKILSCSVAFDSIYTSYSSLSKASNDLAFCIVLSLPSPLFLYEFDLRLIWKNKEEYFGDQGPLSKRNKAAMSNRANTSPTDAFRSASHTINSGAMSHESPSRQASNGRNSLISPSPGSSSVSSRGNPSLLIGQPSPPTFRHPTAPRSSSLVLRRRRCSEKSDDYDPHSDNKSITSSSPPDSGKPISSSQTSPRRSLVDSITRTQSRSARKLNDSMVYLDGPQIYTCGQCRTHLTSHDEIISKSFHGRHGRAYLFDHCVNVRIGPAEDRLLITGLHSVNDIFCKRCKSMIGWTYSRAYESSQKYKEGKFIVEKINLHLEESDYYDVAPPAGERKDRFRARSISWGSDCHQRGGDAGETTIYEYRPSRPALSSSPSPPRDSFR
mmetsp:Transcript_14596/g.30381  ORF Transcript_14596/g.30381 Transcript_14596/m.30381 type:complete len:387 (+) Transcript_14596:332-1492(+)